MLAMLMGQRNRRMLCVLAISAMMPTFVSFAVRLHAFGLSGSSLENSMSCSRIRHCSQKTDSVLYVPLCRRAPRDHLAHCRAAALSHQLLGATCLQSQNCSV